MFIIFFAAPWRTLTGVLAAFVKKARPRARLLKWGSPPNAPAL
jgi:hypothetical protein